MNLVDIVHKLWNNDGRDRPWGYVMPVTIVTAGNLDEEDGDQLNPIPVQVVTAAGGSATASAASVTTVAGAASDTLLLTSNLNRKGAAVFNDSTAILYLKFGSGASSSSFTIKMEAAAYYEVPFQYVGALYGLWASATGNARVTEVS